MGKKTIAYLAHGIKKDKRLKPLESRDFLFTIPKDTISVTITIWYKLISDKLRELLDINDPIFIKKYKIIEYSINM